MKKPTAPEGTAGRLDTGHDTKQRRILHIFAHGHSLNRFEAAAIGDTCLNSTVSSLTHRHGLPFNREWEVVRNRFGSATRVLRYRLTSDSMTKARGILKTHPTRRP